MYPSVPEYVIAPRAADPPWAVLIISAPSNLSVPAVNAVPPIVTLLLFVNPTELNRWLLSGFVVSENGLFSRNWPVPNVRSRRRSFILVARLTWM